VEAVVKIIRSRPLFKWIALSPQKYWHQLAFLDHVNYAGLPYVPGEGAEDEPRTRVFLLR
jgi:hypothetical protein